MKEYEIGFAPDAVIDLEIMARELHCSKADVVRQSLAVMKILLDHQKVGYRVYLDDGWNAKEIEFKR